MEKYYKIKKEFAQRAGLDSNLREEIGNDLLLSEKDIRMISLTTEEKVAALGGSLYSIADPIEDENPDDSAVQEEVDEHEDEHNIEEE